MLERCDREGKVPEAELITYHDRKLSPRREAFATWDGGWVTWLARDDSQASWRWLDEME